MKAAQAATIDRGIFSSPLAWLLKFYCTGPIQKRLFDVYRQVSATTVGLLRAASEVVGGNRALAERLGISQSLLLKFMADTRQLPDPLLLRAVDIILADRQSQPFLDGQPVLQPPASDSLRES